MQSVSVKVHWKIDSNVENRRFAGFSGTSSLVNRNWHTALNKVQNVPSLFNTHFILLSKKCLALMEWLWNKEWIIHKLKNQEKICLILEPIWPILSGCSVDDALFGIGLEQIIIFSARQLLPLRELSHCSFEV